MKKLFLILSIALVLAFPSCDLSSLFEDSEGGVPVEPSPDDDSNTLLGIPSQAKSGEKLIEHDAYTVLYSLDDLSPIWVSWHLDSDDTGGSDRPDDFEPDPMIEEDYQVSESDYTNSGFDRGHLCPNADRNGNSALQAETFYTTNIALQNGKLNQGEWKYLEEEIRSLVRQKDAYEAYIVAGTYGVGGYNEDGDYLESYDNPALVREREITVPAHFWKVILLLPDNNGDLERIDRDVDVIAVDFENEPVPEGKTWVDYVTTVDAIESATDLDIFSELPNDIESYLERTKWVDEDSKAGWINML